MSKPKIQIIIGSTREGRIGEGIGAWVHEHSKTRLEAEYELVDLNDYNIPMFQEAIVPAALNGESYANEAVKKFTAKVAEADGYIFVVPEYNHSMSAALKNAIDYVYLEWTNKSVGFVSYGAAAGGSRAVEQLRLVVANLSMADVQAAVHIINYWSALDENGKPSDPMYVTQLVGVMDQVESWAIALLSVRS